MPTRGPLLACVVLLAAHPATAADPPAVTVAPTAGRGAVFGGEEAEWTFTVTARRPLAGTVSWSFKVGNATAAAREVAVEAAAGKPAEIRVKVLVPPVKDGVVLDARLAVAVAEGRTAAAAFAGDVHVFPKDPFVDRTDRLKKLPIRLYDPARTTAKMLTAANVPFEEVANPAALPDLKDGLVLVGEGASFKEERGLADTLAKLAAGGVAVLVLAPADGELVVPGLAGASTGATEVTFRRDIVRRLDKRLANDVWPADPKAVAATVAVRPGDAGVVAEASPAADGWPWAEARFAGPGRWAVCGPAVMSRWDDGPTARYLFARMIDHLTETDSPKKDGG